MRIEALLVLILCTYTFCTPIKGKSEKEKRNAECTDACPVTDSSTLNVHIVPHSHDDVGWLKTVDQYYFGSNSSIQKAGVQYIIDSVIWALQENPERKFIQVETAFFKQWWGKQSDFMKKKVIELNQNGQLEIIGGAWSMNDEAAVNYQSTIDQFTYGLRFINDTLGSCAAPKIGWQIDPFGHSREMASIFAQLGFDALFFSRLDWRDKSTRKETKNMELIWKGSASLGSETDLFTSVLFNHYSAPSGFCFDYIHCSTFEPIVADVESPEYNHKSKVEAFAAFVRNQAQYYKTNNIIITMGDDFNYQDALTYFHNLDLVIEGFKIYEQTYNNKTIKLFYSTPSCYAKSVNAEALASGLSFSEKTDDFFPLGNDHHTYWTGYYTSRPTSKRFERQGNNILQVAKQLAAATNVTASLTKLQEVMGTMQHHDAITGTEKQHVANDYHRLLTIGINQGINVSSTIIEKILKTDQEIDDVTLTSCLLANISSCEISANSVEFTTIVYNPLSHRVSQYVRLPVNSTQFKITTANNTTVTWQVTKPLGDFSYTGKSISKYELVFLAKNLPALGYKVYSVKNLDPNDENPDPIAAVYKDKFVLGNERFRVSFNDNTKRLQSITVDNVTLDVQQELMYYIGAKGNNSGDINRASGAYIFRPSPNEPNAQSFSEITTITETYKGLVLDEYHQVFSDWAKQVVRVYKEEELIEFEWIVGPIDRSDDKGKEVISRFTTSLNTDDVFYTDANGREMIKRVRNFRPDFNVTIEELAAGNYYPVTSRIVLKDEGTGVEFAVLNDRAQGGTSLRSGEVELMVHRRCINDDAFGVGESLNEEQYGQGLVAKGHHYIVVGQTSPSNGSSAAIKQRELAQKKLLEPWVFLTNANVKENVPEYSALNGTVPSQVNILTLEPLDAFRIILRLEHFLEVGEDTSNSSEVVVDLEGLFENFDVTDLRETTLGANQWLEDNNRLKWNKEELSKNGNSRIREDKASLKVSLTPMQIRTFIATVVYKKSYA